jgi:hypothetical protein
MGKKYFILPIRISSESTSDGNAMDLRIRAPCKVTIDRNRKWVKIGGKERFLLSKIKEFSQVDVLTSLREACEFPEEEQRFVVDYNAYRKPNVILIGSDEHEVVGEFINPKDPYNEDDL